MNKKKRIIIIGATSAIAEHCARLWVQGTLVDITLVGRDIQKVKRIANDLLVRSPQSNIEVMQAQFTDPIEIQKTVELLAEKNVIDLVLIAHGSLPEQNICENDLKTCHETLEINGISPVLYAEAFAMHMAKNRHGTIALIGSVAGDRGRKSNYVYGAAKSLVSCYMQGLQHRFSGTGVKIVLVKPGPTDTPMTAHLKNQGAKLALVNNVALNIVNGIEKGSAVIYAPKKWQLIMWVIRNIPNRIFNKINI